MKTNNEIKRVSVTDENGQFAGWFDHNKAEEIAKYTTEGTYKTGYILLATKGGKLIVNVWKNYNDLDEYRFADDEEEIATILVNGGYVPDKSKLDAKLEEILSKYEL